MELAADSLKRPNAPWLWRLIATGLSFALFGIGRPVPAADHIPAAFAAPR